METTNKATKNLLDALFNCIYKRGNYHDARDSIIEKITELKDFNDQIQMIKLVQDYDPELIRFSDLYINNAKNTQLIDYILKNHYQLIDETPLRELYEDNKNDKDISIAYEQYLNYQNPSTLESPVSSHSFFVL